MAEFTVIPDANLEPEKPGRAIDALALRDNPIAIAEGAAGAPRIQTPALAPPTAGTAHIIRRVQEATISAATDVYPNPNNHDRFSHEHHLGVTVLVPGVITAYAEHRKSGGFASDSMSLRVLKNGSLVQEWTTSTTTSTFIQRQVDISVDVGDVVIFQQRRSGGSGEWRHLRIYSNNPNMAVA